jgi:hypothetical protein
VIQKKFGTRVAKNDMKNLDMKTRIDGEDIIACHHRTTATMNDRVTTSTVMLLEIVIVVGRTPLVRMNQPLTRTKSTAAVLCKSRSGV